ncbi:TPA: transposase [Yersinia enterocolitica]|uniref:transposase n=1 Tax=Yersinia enterocolitica TaxID=630 RepID=UPI0005FCF85A|nr:transposase [Yersinia enterocolitica]EKN5930979.1 IS110 family transposase [Yersinia enterocolitica]CRE57142.1 Transposase and inactivated derivatives%2C IS30 family [Yersinia enterocolitica]
MKRRTRINYTPEQKAIIWDRYKQGDSLHDIARMFDRYHSSIMPTIHQTGGYRPPVRKRHRLALSLDEREEISRGLVAKRSIRDIADKLSRAPSTIIRLLQQLVEQRRQLIEDKRRFVNRLINTLKQYYPQLLGWFSHRGSLLLCDLIIRWPSLQQLKRARRDTIRNFLNAKGGRATALTGQRVASIDNAIPLMTDPSVIEANALMATALATQIKVVSEIIKTYDERIETLFDTLPDAGLFKSLPGMGPCMSPRMLAALGDNRDRFNSAEEIQNYAGIAPVTERSGQKSWVHWRWQCAKFVRQTFVEWTAKTVNSSYWARLYYQGQREKGKSHQSAIRALAFKWIRIIYRCWKTRTQYDEAKYLLALEARHSPLLKP